MRVCVHLLKYFVIYSSGWGIFFFNFILCIFFCRRDRVFGNIALMITQGIFKFISFPSSSYLSYFFDFSPVNNLWCFKFLFYFFSSLSLIFEFYFLLLFSGWSLFFYDKCSNLMFLCLENFFYYLFLLCCASSSLKEFLIVKRLRRKCVWNI